MSCPSTSDNIFPLRSLSKRRCSILPLNYRNRERTIPKDFSSAKEAFLPILRFVFQPFMVLLNIWILWSYLVCLRFQRSKLRSASNTSKEEISGNLFPVLKHSNPKTASIATLTNYKIYIDFSHTLSCYHFCFRFLFQILAHLCQFYFPFLSFVQMYGIP